MGEQERVLHYDKMATACAHFPPLGPDSLRRGEERGKLLFEIKNRSKEDAATGNMRALLARRDSQNYYRKNGQKGQLWTAGTSG